MLHRLLNIRGLALTVLALSLPLAGCLHKPPEQAPMLKIGSAADVGPRLDNFSEVTIPADGSIVVAGDEFVRKADFFKAAKGKKPPPSISLADAIAKATKLNIIDESRPADTIAAGAERVAAAAPGNLLVICYGFGDAQAKTAGPQFQSTLEGMIRHAHERGAAVYLVTEPATALPDSALVEPFRAIARTVGPLQGAGVIDAPPALVKATLGPSKTRTQPVAAVKIIAGLVAQYIKVSPAKGS